MQTFTHSAPGISDYLPVYSEFSEGGGFYEIIAAGKRGMSALVEIACGLDHNLVKLAPDSRRFDPLGEANSADNVVRDVRAARQLILSLCGNMPHLCEFKIWMVAILNQEQKNQAAVISLLDLDKMLTGQTAQDFDVLLHVALETELDFIEPWTASEASDVRQAL